MRYAQIRGGRKLHLVYEPGEDDDPSRLIPVGYLSAPLCNTPAFRGHYRMNINVPLGHACHNCLRVWRAREER